MTTHSTSYQLSKKEREKELVKKTIVLYYTIAILKSYGVQCHFQQYFSYIVVVSFIGGGTQCTREKTTDLPQVTNIGEKKNFTALIFFFKSLKSQVKMKLHMKITILLNKTIKSLKKLIILIFCLRFVCFLCSLKQ